MRVTKGGRLVGSRRGRRWERCEGRATKATGGHRTRRDRVRLDPFKCDSCRPGKVNECNCAGTSPFLFFRLLFHFSLFPSFPLFLSLSRDRVALFFLTTGSTDPSPFSCPAIAVNLSVHARIRRVVRSNQESSSQSRANFLV